jgi:hypothetical protein
MPSEDSRGRIYIRRVVDYVYDSHEDLTADMKRWFTKSNEWAHTRNFSVKGQLVETRQPATDEENEMRQLAVYELDEKADLERRHRYGSDTAR